MNKKIRLSAGTILFLSLAVGIVILTMFFLLFISGSDFHRINRPRNEATPAEADLLPVIREQPVDSQREHPKEAPENGTVEASVPSRVVLSFAGDITVPKSMQDTMMINDHEYDFTPVFAGVSSAFSEADLSIATLETLISNLAPYDTYNAPPDLLEALKASGIHHLNLASEHMMDLGVDGLKATKLELTRLGMEYSGYLSQKESDALISVNGIRIAVLAYTYGLSDEGRVLAGKLGLADIPIFSVQKVLESIRTVRAQGADLVIVLPHWGTKNVGTVTETMRKTAQQMAEAGADLIIGTHPNVVSESEYIHTKRADGRMHETLICYSLGALLMDARNEENATGMILNVEIEYEPETRQCHIQKCRPVTVYIYQDSINDRRTWRILNIPDEKQLEQVPEKLQTRARSALEVVKAATEEIKR